MPASNNVFTKIAAGRPVPVTPEEVKKSRNWFREVAKNIAVTPGKLFEQNRKNLVRDINITSVGSLYSYHYDPKWKAVLPYYDTFPLSFIVEIYYDGFLGLNVHYLPPYLRAKLMDSLYEIALKEGDMQKLQLSYGLLKSASRFNYYKPCVKRYLASHVTSRFLFIEPAQWDIALFLPTARWVKGSEDQIYKDSRRLAQ